MRYPDIHGDTVVFVYGNDIWKAPAAGGTALRLTIHDGDESFPRFSPDGSLIAFTGEYDGDSDVYVMNADGGEIARVTWEPGSDQVVGWYPTKNKILFTSSRNTTGRVSRLYLISPDGTGLEELIMHWAAAGSFSPDGTQIAFNKVSREDRTWKRYQGGLAQEVYLYDFATDEERNLTNFRGTDRAPMWVGGSVYFSSDRDGVLNIYRADPASGSIEQVTRHTEYDVRRPSAGGGRIVYELGGTLWLLDTASGETAQVPVEIRADAPEARPAVVKVDEQVSGIEISPSGKRALVTARGEVFSVPRENGPTRNLSDDCGARDRDAAWSPDGSKIAWISDKRGEYEIWLADADGSGEPVKLTSHADGYRHTLRWSPDSGKIAFADQTLRCYYLDVATKKITEVDKAQFEDVDVSINLKPIHDFAWSPDSRYIAYSKMDETLVQKVYIHELASRTNRCVSSGLFNDFGPVFSRDGKHLFFISNRRFDPTFCDFEWEMVYKKVAGIYCLTLQKDGGPLLPPKSDEETAGEEKGKDGDEERDATEVVIDFDGLADRIEALPLPRGNYRGLAAGQDTLFYLDAEEGDFNRFEFREAGPRDLHAFSFEDREAKKVIGGISEYRLSADGKSIIYRKGSAVGIISASDRDSKGEALGLSGLQMTIDPAREWAQIFNEAWRLERDFYYDPNMQGIDWPAMKEKYGRLLPFASCRQDLTYIIGEMIGELNTSHTYVYSGDSRREAERVNIGLLGADWEEDSAANRYRFARIYDVADWTLEVIPPLAGPGKDVAAGDYLLAVNGAEVTADRNIHSYFEGLAGRQVTLLVNSSPSAEGARELVVEPLRSDRTLRYRAWVEDNRKKVDQASGGKLGYLHLPDTYTGSTREFPEYFYSQTRKQGLVIDGRYNAGGLDPDIFLQRLDKETLAYWTRRYSHDQTTPAVATRAHLALLTNQRAGSGGDMLPMEFQMRKMGPVIGMRTWGGLVGVSMFIGLIDGGAITAPDYRIYDPSGRWIVEGEGVTPDIEVEIDSADMAKGIDAQLNAAIDYLMKKIEEDPRPWPVHEPFPTDK
jgi:tricorn protease